MDGRVSGDCLVEGGVGRVRTAEASDEEKTLNKEVAHGKDLLAEEGKVGRGGDADSEGLDQCGCPGADPDVVCRWVGGSHRE
jgi:hypothetical protein